jgi:hypothetical protein
VRLRILPPYRGASGKGRCPSRPLHGRFIGTGCNESTVNGTNVTPTTTNPPPALTFTDSPGPIYGCLPVEIEILIPDDTPGTASLTRAIGGTQAGPTDTSTIAPVPVSLVSPWRRKLLPGFWDNRAPRPRTRSALCRPRRNLTRVSKRWATARAQTVTGFRTCATGDQFGARRSTSPKAPFRIHDRFGPEPVTSQQRGLWRQNRRDEPRDASPFGRNRSSDLRFRRPFPARTNPRQLRHPLSNNSARTKRNSIRCREALLMNTSGFGQRTCGPTLSRPSNMSDRRSLGLTRLRTVGCGSAGAIVEDKLVPRLKRDEDIPKRKRRSGHNRISEAPPGET